MKNLILISFMLFFSINCFSQTGKWKNVLRKNTISEYKKFIEKYPESEYLDSAKFKIIELEFNKVEFLDTYSGYTYFLDKYGHNAYSEKARDGLTKLEFNRVKTVNKIYVYKNFLKEYGENPFSEEVKNKIAEIESKEVESLKREEESLKREEAILAKIKNYNIGELTERQFFLDGWNPVDSYLGKIGVIEIYGTINTEGKKNLIVKMGNVLGFHSSLGSEIKSEFQAIFDQFIKYQGVVPHLHFVGVERVPKAEILCILIFKQGLLDDIMWSKDNKQAIEGINTPVLKMDYEGSGTSSVGTALGWTDDRQRIWRSFNQGIRREGSRVLTGRYELQTLVGDGRKSALECEKYAFYAKGYIL